MINDKMTLPYGLTLRGIIKNDKDEILLLRRHPKSKHEACMWEFPGGKIKNNEYFDEGLLREVKEETNLDADIDNFCEAVPMDYPHRKTVQIVMYLKNIKGEIKISDEHDMWMWASKNKMKEINLTSTVKKIIEKLNR